MLSTWLIPVGDVLITWLRCVGPPGLNQGAGANPETHSQVLTEAGVCSDNPPRSEGWEGSAVPPGSSAQEGTPPRESNRSLLQSPRVTGSLNPGS